MAAEIVFPDGTPAYFTGTHWESPDASARVVAEYFSDDLPFGYYLNYPEALAKHVVSQIAGARVVKVDPIEKDNNPPGTIY